MISPVDPFIEAFCEAGADGITVHPEAGPHVHRTLQHIRACGKRPGVVLNPGTPIDAIDNLLDLVDLVLIMTVNPGFGGQDFIESQLRKIEAAAERIARDPAAPSIWKWMAASRRKRRGAPSMPARIFWWLVHPCSKAAQRTTPPTSPRLRG